LGFIKILGPNNASITTWLLLLRCSPML
jgi:hypothetical protein